MAQDNWVASMAVISGGRELPLRSEAFFNAHYLKNLYHDVGASFILTVPPVTFQVEIGKVVEKANVET